MRTELPKRGTDWTTLKNELVEFGKHDVDWRSARTAVYVFNAGEDVLSVAKEAYALYQSENALGPAAFPSLREMERQVVEMGLSLLEAPDGACGDITSGGSESIFLAVKACRNQARAEGRVKRGGNLVLPISAHPAFDKAASVLDLSVKRVPVAANLRADVGAMRDAIDAETLMIVGSAPCFPYGLIDPISELGALATETNTWLHVDACVGGYFAPFARMNGEALPDFDFRVPAVRSISADLHKYGYAAKGASTIFHRTEDQREHQVFTFDQWPAGGMRTPTAAGTRPGGAIASAFAVLRYLGVEGYREKARTVADTRERLIAGIEELGLHVWGDPRLGLLSYGSNDLDIFAVWKHLAEKGWFTGLTTQPRGIHLMLSPAHAQVAGDYLDDLRDAVDRVRAGSEDAADLEARYA
ncbi:MAG: aspartate aminotransferase family protein [Myxococcota bacterium]